MTGPRLRFTWPFQLIGPLLLLLAFAFPLLIVFQDHKRLQVTDYVTAGAFFLFGVYCTLDSATYSVEITEDGFILTRFWRRREVKWRNVIKVISASGTNVFVLEDSRRVKVSSALGVLEHVPPTTPLVINM